MTEIGAFVWGVFHPADLIMGDPTDHDELISLWRTEERADREARRLTSENGYEFTVHRLDVHD